MSLNALLQGVQITMGWVLCESLTRIDSRSVAGSMQGPHNFMSSTFSQYAHPHAPLAHAYGVESLSGLCAHACAQYMHVHTPIAEPLWFCWNLSLVTPLIKRDRMWLFIMDLGKALIFNDNSPIWELNIQGPKTCQLHSTHLVSLLISFVARGAALIHCPSFSNFQDTPPWLAASHPIALWSCQTVQARKWTVIRCSSLGQEVKNNMASDGTAEGI